MTLSTQNKLLLWFSTCSSLLGIYFVVSTLFILIAHPENYIDTALFSDFSFIKILTEQSSLYKILSISFFALYVPILGFTIYVTFEKTKAPEIIYFNTMLLGLFAQTFLLFIPIFSLQETYTLFFRSIGKIAFFGQVQVMLSVLVHGALVIQDEARDSDKFIGIISVVALTFSIIVPINMTNTSSTLFPQYGFESVFDIMRIAFVLLAFFAMFFSPTSKKSHDYRISAVAFLVLCTGYILLLSAKTMIPYLMGIFFMIFGTYQFLKRLHSYYMWK